MADFRDVLTFSVGSMVLRGSGLFRSLPAVFTALLVIAGCASTPKPVILTVTLVAADDVNPDAQGRASPVVARLYALRAPGAFEFADFFSLQDKDMSTLGADLVQREEAVLRPGEAKKFRFEFAPDTRLVGFTGAFRDLTHARWRQTVPLSSGKALSITAIYGSSGIDIEKH